MNAVWMRTRAELRSSMRSTVALALLLGLFGGIALAAVAGARRTDSAYGRFVADTNPPDAVVFSGTAPGQPFTVVPFARVLALPQVRDGRVGPTLTGELATTNGHVLVGDNNLSVYGLANGPAAPFLGVKLLRGRLPDPNNPHEVALGYSPSLDRAAPVGSTLRLALVGADVPPSIAESFAVPPRYLLPPITVKVVGQVLGEGELTGSPDVFVTSAIRSYIQRSFQIPTLTVHLKHGLADYPAFSREVAGVSTGAYVWSPVLDEADVVQRATHLFASALWVFGALTLVAGALVFGQAILRQNFLAASENPFLGAVGMTGRQLFGVAMLRTAVVATGGALAATAVAFALSTLMPIGHLARLSDPHPGASFDALVLLPGAAALIATSFAIVAWPAYRMARLRASASGVRLDPEGRSRPSAVASAFAAGGFPASVIAGVRMAFERGRGRSAVPVRSALIGTALSIAALAAAITFGSNLTRLVDTPRLYGFGWQYQAGGAAVTPEMQAAIAGDPNVGAVAGADLIDTVTVGPRGHAVQVSAFATQEIRGAVSPTVDEGRWPTSSSQIDLGAITMRNVGAHVGSTVLVSSGNRAVRMRVVGQAVLPELGFNGPGLGNGAGLTIDGLRTVTPTAHIQGFGFDFKPGTNAPAAIQELNGKLNKLGAGVSSVSAGGVTNLSKIEGLPLALAGMIALAGLAGLGNLLVTSIRRRRRDLAILKTIGFVRGQVRTAVAWQASSVSLVAAAVGVPIGIAAGRWVWTLFANAIGVFPTPAVPVAAVLVVIPAAILAANVLAALPGRAAARTLPAVALRAE
jgi:putative ABC transport system permease protein